VLMSNSAMSDRSYGGSLRSKPDAHCKPAKVSNVAIPDLHTFLAYMASWENK
jgi:hypothetical protein